MGSLVLASLFVTTETESSVTADVGSTVTLSAVTTTNLADCYDKISSEDLDSSISFSFHQLNLFAL